MSPKDDAAELGLVDAEPRLDVIGLIEVPELAGYLETGNLGLASRHQFIVAMSRAQQVRSTEGGEARSMHGCRVQPEMDRRVIKSMLPSCRDGFVQRRLGRGFVDRCQKTATAQACKTVLSGNRTKFDLRRRKAKQNGAFESNVSISDGAQEISLVRRYNDRVLTANRHYW